MTAILPPHQAMLLLAVAQLLFNLRAVHAYLFIRCSASFMLFIFYNHMPHVNLTLFIKAVPSPITFLAVLDAHPLCMSFNIYTSILPLLCGCIMFPFHFMAMLDACL